MYFYFKKIAGDLAWNGAKITAVKLEIKKQIENERTHQRLTSIHLLFVYVAFFHRIVPMETSTWRTTSIRENAIRDSFVLGVFYKELNGFDVF